MAITTQTRNHQIQNQRQVDDLVKKVTDLQARIKSSNSSLDKADYYRLSPPLLDKLSAILVNGAVVPSSLLPILLFLLSGEQKNVKPVCRVLGNLQSSFIINAFKSEFKAYYKQAKSRANAVEVFLSSGCYDDIIGEYLIEMLMETRSAIIKNISSPVVSSTKLGTDLNMNVLNKAVNLVSSKTPITLSCRLAAALIDLVVVLPPNDSSIDLCLEALEKLMLHSPCRHPSLPVVLTLFKSFNKSSKTLDLIVHPRTAPIFKRNVVVGSVPIKIQASSDTIPTVSGTLPTSVANVLAEEEDQIEEPFRFDLESLNKSSLIQAAASYGPGPSHVQLVQNQLMPQQRPSTNEPYTQSKKLKMESLEEEDDDLPTFSLEDGPDSDT